MGRLEVLLEGSKAAGTLREGDRFGLHPPIGGPDGGEAGGGNINADKASVLSSEGVELMTNLRRRISLFSPVV